MKSWKNYLTAVALLLVLGSLVVGFGSFFKAYVVEPISLLFWAVWRLVTSIDQAIIWTVMILVCVVLVIGLVAGGEKGSPQSAYHLPIVSVNRLEYWQKLIDEAALGVSEKENLRRSLLELLRQAEASRGWSAQEELPQFSGELSDTANRFLTQKATIGFGWAPRELRRWLGKHLSSQDEVIDEILRLVEIELEYGNGN